jgi:hypothetical protein
MKKTDLLSENGLNDHENQREVNHLFHENALT